MPRTWKRWDRVIVTRGVYRNISMTILGIDGNAVLVADSSGETRVVSADRLKPWTPIGGMIASVLLELSFIWGDMSRRLSSADKGPYWKGRRR